MLSNYSIQKMRESQYQSKVRAYNNHLERQRFKQNILIIKYDNSRNLNKVSLANSESSLHNYAKFITGLVLKQNKCDFINEFRTQSGKEVDIYDLSNNNFIELERINFEKKLEHYQNELNQGLINDVFIIPLDDFKGNLQEDMDFVRERLGL
jgi:hypothetical protein